MATRKLTTRQIVAVGRVGRVAGVVLGLVVLTGVAQFLFRPGTRPVTEQQARGIGEEPATALESIHHVLGAVAVVVVVLGGIWLTHVLDRRDRLVVIVAVVVGLTYWRGNWVAYDFAQLGGEPGTGRGYLQFFTDDVDWVKTDAGFDAGGFQSGWGYRLNVLLHVLSAPALLGYVWFSIRARQQAVQHTYEEGATRYGRPIDPETGRFVD